MPAPKQTKKQRIEEARQAARLAREKREKRQKLLKVLVPSLVTFGVLAIAAVVVIVIAIQPKATPVASGVGPKNMASYGVQFTADDGKLTTVSTKAPKSGAAPTTPTAEDGKIQIIEYIDLSCPTCKLFEGNTSTYAQSLVKKGDATLELRPIAILDRNYTTNYSTRINNAAACIANFDVDRFLPFVTKAYTQQPDEGSAGLTDAQITSLAHSSGASSASIDQCISKQSFAKWITATTTHATEKASVGGTPTVLLNGETADLGQFTLDDFKTALAAAA